jgi:glycosyltransferase involved in cell wall biosynthesis
MSVERVTVIMAVFNGEKHIGEAIESVMSQSYTNWLLYIIDDGSADETLNIANQYSEADSRITVFSIPNGGVANARNYGISRSNTEWLCLLDHDDVYLPHKLECQFQYINSNPDTLCLGSYGYRMGSEGRVIANFDVGPSSLQEFNDLRRNNQIVYMLAASAMFRRNIPNVDVYFKKERGGTEDIELWNRIADSHPIVVLTERLVKYRIHTESVSSKSLKIQRLNSKKIQMNMIKRRNGESELSDHAFDVYYQKNTSFLLKNKDKISILSSYCYRRAGSMIADGKKTGYAYLVLSFLLSPVTISKRVIIQRRNL